MTEKLKICPSCQTKVLERGIAYYDPDDPTQLHDCIPYLETQRQYNSASPEITFQPADQVDYSPYEELLQKLNHMEKKLDKILEWIDAKT